MYTINFEPFNFPSQFWAAEMLFAIHTQLRTESFLLSVQSWVHTEHCWFSSGVFWAGCFSSNFQGGSQQFLGLNIKPHFQSQMSEESSKQGHIKWKNTPKCAIRNELCHVCVFQCAFDLDPVSEKRCTHFSANVGKTISSLLRTQILQPVIKLAFVANLASLARL